MGESQLLQPTFAHGQASLSVGVWFFFPFAVFPA